MRRSRANWAPVCRTKSPACSTSSATPRRSLCDLRRHEHAGQFEQRAVPLPTRHCSAVLRAAGGQPGQRQPGREFIQLTNPTPFALDISGWQLDGRCSSRSVPHDHSGRGSLYVSPDVNAFRARAASRERTRLLVQGTTAATLGARRNRAAEHGESWLVRESALQAPESGPAVSADHELMYSPPAWPVTPRAPRSSSSSN